MLYEIEDLIEVKRCKNITYISTTGLKSLPLEISNSVNILMFYFKRGVKVLQNLLLAKVFLPFDINFTGFRVKKGNRIFTVSIWP